MSSEEILSLKKKERKKKRKEKKKVLFLKEISFMPLAGITSPDHTFNLLIVLMKLSVIEKI